MIVLYDLVAANGRRFSPNCWRTRLALAHKGLSHEARPVRFTEIAKIADGRQKTVPVIEDGEHIVGDSAVIADYLETMYPERPSLFGGVSGHALTQFVQSWAISTLHGGILELIVLDIHDALAPADQPYFRESRERRFGRRLEDMQAGRDERLPGFRASLGPLRQILKTQAWIGGDTPLYADYVAFAPFQWARSISDVRLLEEDDPVTAWVERCLDLHGGLARSA